MKLKSTILSSTASQYIGFFLNDEMDNINMIVLILFNEICQHLKICITQSLLFK